MWVWRGGWGCPIDMAESKKTLSGVFQEQKHNKKKNCNQLHAIFLIKSKSSQVKSSKYFDIRFLFVGAI